MFDKIIDGMDVRNRRDYRRTKRRHICRAMTPVRKRDPVSLPAIDFRQAVSQSGMGICKNSAVFARAVKIGPHRRDMAGAGIPVPHEAFSMQVYQYPLIAYPCGDLHKRICTQFFQRHHYGADRACIDEKGIEPVGTGQRPVGTAVHARVQYISITDGEYLRGMQRFFKAHTRAKPALHIPESHILDGCLNPQRGTQASERLRQGASYLLGRYGPGDALLERKPKPRPAVMPVHPETGMVDSAACQRCVQKNPFQCFKPAFYTWSCRNPPDCSAHRRA